MAYKKPQDPLINNGFGIYPLTTADQVILSDGSRLEKVGKINADKLDGRTLAEIMLALYPVGAVYISANSTSTASLFGGTWEQIKGRFLLACGNNGDGYDYSPGSTGGEPAHTLTVNEMPSHNHSHPNSGHTFSWGDRSSTLRYNTGAMEAAGASGNELTSYQGPNNYTNYTGGNAAHNNLPPYLSVYMWKRVS